MISGTEYYRRLRRMSKANLAGKAGLNILTLRKMLQNQDTNSISIHCLLRVSDALNVPIDDLLLSRDETELDEGGYIPPSRTENPQNCISVYRHVKSLTFQVLGNRLGGLSKERARVICAADAPTEKQVQKLAAYEGISPEMFRTLYAPQMEKAV